MGHRPVPLLLGEERELESGMRPFPGELRAGRFKDSQSIRVEGLLTSNSALTFWICVSLLLVLESLRHVQSVFYHPVE